MDVATIATTIMYVICEFRHSRRIVFRQRFEIELVTETVILRASHEGVGTIAATITYPVSKIHEVDRFIPFSYTRKLAGDRIETSVAHGVIIRALEVIIKDASQVMVPADERNFW
jgi:hypothetical protein